MSDQLSDSTYDHVNAKCWGSLEEDLPEYLCDEFFRTHGDINGREAIHSVSRVAEDEASFCSQTLLVTLSPYLQQSTREHDPQVNSRPSQDVNRPQQPVEATASEIQNENRPLQPIVAKASENIEDLSRLAMFGKQKKVLRRSQIQLEQKAAGAPSSASRPLSSRHSSQRETPSRGAVPAPVTSVRSSCSQRTGPPVRVISDTQQKVSLTADASTESTTSQMSYETANKARSTPSDQVANLAKGVSQLGIGTERRARDRAPRTNTSSSAKNPLRSDPVRIGRCPQSKDASLRSTTVPSENEFRRELVTRVSSLGPKPRSTSTPRNDNKAACTASAVMSANRDTSRTRRLVASAPRAGTTAKPHRPPSVTRPKTPVVSSSRPIPSRSGATIPKSTSAQQGTTSQVIRNENPRPLGPRSTVISRTPVLPREKGDGTPLRGFRSKELRQHPAPTSGSITSSTVEVSSTASSATEARSKLVLTKERERAMISRLAVPKNAAARTPLKVSNVQTHGLSCVKVRSRSSSVVRRPASTLSNGSAPSCSQALPFSGVSGPSSVEPTVCSKPAAVDGDNVVE
ncbi:unnamed protein product [Haemonchus placei]|uniref:GTSE1_N domain-containing protein n=1 Tax=Haemonchus placei TaxID=6290 RepID=A0A158QJT7_HAEPC|nr:unnamed protein product [Haemonchus placei]